MAKGVTLGSDPITGVYVGSDLATGLYIGNERVWPLQTGVVSIGHGTFNFLPQPLAVETDQVIRIAPAALTFVGRPLSVSIGGMVSVWIAPGTFHFTGRPLATRADAAMALGAGTVQFHGQALGLGVGGAVAVSIQAGAVQFTGAALTVEVGTSAAVGLDAGSLNFTGAVLTVTATANGEASVGTGSFQFTGEQLLLTTSKSVAASLNAGSLTFTGQPLAVSANANAPVDIGAGAFAFSGQPLSLRVTRSVSLSVNPGTLDFTGQALTVDSGSTATSTWEAYDLPGPAHWKGAAHGSGVFVAMASDEGFTMTSADAASWTAHSFGGGAPAVVAVFFGGDQFIALSPNSENFLASGDGVNWGAGQFVLSNPAALNWTCGCYGNGTYVALASSTMTGVYSTVGSARNWHYSGLPTESDWSAVCYGDRFVAVATGGTAAAASLDGISWSQGTLPVSAAWSGVAFGNSTYVAVASGSAIAATSADGETWAQQTLPASETWSAIAFGAGLFVAVGGINNAVTSADGVTWTARTLPSSRGWATVAFVNGVFVALADDDDVCATSTDGITWTAGSIKMPQPWSSIVYGGGKFVAVCAATSEASSGATLAAVSDDGQTWSRGTLPRATVWNAVAYGGGTFVAVSEGVTITDTVAATSTDGIAWTEHSLPFRAEWTMLAYGNSLFMAAARGAGILTSPDGATWTVQDLPTGHAWAAQALFTDITFGDGLFKLSVDNFGGSGYNNFICATTTDGSSWHTEGLTLWGAGSITHGDSQFVALPAASADIDGSAVSAFGDGNHTWTYGDAEVSGRVRYAMGKYFAFPQVTGGSATVSESTDGLNWSESTLPQSGVWRDAAGSDDVIVLIGDGAAQALKLSLTPSGALAVEVGTGSLAFAGQPLGLTTDAKVDVGAGALTFTGRALEMSLGHPVVVDLGAGAFAFTGQALGVLADMSVDMGAGSFDLSGQPLAVTASSSGTSPSLVQSTYDNVFLPSISIALDTAPTAGHLLTLNVFPDAGQTITTPPDGFTACDRTGENTSRPMWVYYKIADGSEQTVSADLSSSAGVGAVYSEWQDATTVSALTGTSFNPGISSGTAGPSAAPPNASAIPIYWLVSRAQTPYVATVGSGWTIDPNYAANVNYAPCQAYMTSAPNEAVSIDFTLTGTDSSYFQWTTAWIY